MHDGAADNFALTPPHSIPAEMAFLASAMLDKGVFDEARPLLTRDSFFQADHGIIFGVICDLYARAGTCDGLLVREELARRKLLEEVGGVAYLGGIFNAVPSAANGVHYAKVIAEQAKWRALIEATNRTLRRAYEPHYFDAADEAAAQLERDVASIRECGVTDTIRRLSELAAEVLRDKRDKKVTREKTGLDELDDLCGGLPVCGLTYIAGGAGMGKSQIVKQILINRTLGGTPCGLISIEESGHKIAENMLANLSGVTNSDIVYNTLNQEQWGELERANARLADVPYFVDDVPMKLSAIIASARRMVRKYGCKIIAVDHQHLIQGDASNARENREQELTHISGALKSLWKELKVSGVVACQVNRGATQGEDSPPELTHLRGTGSLEQDGDLIVMLHRPDYYRWKKEGPNFRPDHRLLAYVNKNKGGPVGHVELYFDGDRQEVGAWNNGAGPHAPIETPWDHAPRVTYQTTDPF